jgi:hypothetical protein
MSWMWGRLILSRVRVTLDGVWIDNWIYWPLSNRNYTSLTELHTRNIIVTTAHIKSSLVIDFNTVLWRPYRLAYIPQLNQLHRLSLLFTHSLAILSALQLTPRLAAISHQPLHRLTFDWLSSESESEILYDWRFTANQFVLATSPLRLTTSIFFSTEHLRS